MIGPFSDHSICMDNIEHGGGVSMYLLFDMAPCSHIVPIYAIIGPIVKIFAVS